jgi:AcrR family transcriptional regulator
MISNRPEQMFEPPGAEEAPRRDSEFREGYDERLGHILEAATRVMAQAGYEKASMRMVAKTAGVSLAGMYHYFDSKERMLFLIQFRTFNSLLNKLKEKLHGVEDPMEQLFAMVRSHIGYFAANMAALKVCSHELDSLSGTSYDETRQIRRAYYELTRGIIDRVLDKQAPGAALDRHVLTMSLFGTLNWLYRWYDPKGGRPPASVANQIAAQFLFGALGPQSATIAVETTSPSGPMPKAGDGT